MIRCVRRCSDRKLDCNRLLRSRLFLIGCLPNCLSLISSQTCSSGFNSGISSISWGRWIRAMLHRRVVNRFCCRAMEHTLLVSGSANTRSKTLRIGYCMMRISSQTASSGPWAPRHLAPFHLDGGGDHEFSADQFRTDDKGLTLLRQNYIRSSAGLGSSTLELSIRAMGTAIGTRRPSRFSM